jgi:hypothetical protein
LSAAPMYSPSRPTRKIWTDPRKKLPVTDGAYPAGRDYQN